MRELVLFSGTGSVEIESQRVGHECRGVDISNKFNPYYNVDILKWDYKSELESWIPDFIWCSFPCTEFTNNKNRIETKRNINTGLELLNKGLEIINYCKTLNPELIYMLENPNTSRTSELPQLSHLNKYNTTYCKYGFYYKKPTSIWSNIKLKLESPCMKNDTNLCKGRLLNKSNHNKHLVRIGFSDRPHQTTDVKYFSKMKETNEYYKHYTITEFRDRIPPKLVQDILVNIDSHIALKNENILDSIQENKNILDSIQENIIYNGQSEKILELIQKNSIDLIVTSPPYDNLRGYNGVEWNLQIFKIIANGLYNVLKEGGTLVWIVNDQTINGSETGTSFKQALYFQSIGFKLNDTMIWQKPTSPFPSGINSKRYTQSFEYMFILTKGNPKTINLIKDKRNKSAGSSNWGQRKHRRNKNGIDTIEVENGVTINEMGYRTNIWNMSVENNLKKEEKFIHKHPAIFPIKLVSDHIRSWSNEGDIVLDPFAGSGTTLVAAHQLNRKFIGIECNQDYIEIMKKRLELHCINFKLT